MSQRVKPFTKAELLKPLNLYPANMPKLSVSDWLDKIHKIASDQGIKTSLFSKDWLYKIKTDKLTASKVKLINKAKTLVEHFEACKKSLASLKPFTSIEILKLSSLREPLDLREPTASEIADRSEICACKDCNDCHARNMQRFKLDRINASPDMIALMQRYLDTRGKGGNVKLIENYYTKMNNEYCLDTITEHDIKKYDIDFNERGYTATNYVAGGIDKKTEYDFKRIPIIAVRFYKYSAGYCNYPHHYGDITILKTAKSDMELETCKDIIDCWDSLQEVIRRRLIRREMSNNRPLSGSMGLNDSHAICLNGTLQLDNMIDTIMDWDRSDSLVDILKLIKEDWTAFAGKDLINLPTG